MSNEQIEKPKMLGVHTLSEFVFCPRAGVISQELNNNDSGVDTGFVDLSYSPDYDIVLAKQQFSQIGKRFEKFSFGLLGATLTTAILGTAIKPFLGILCLLIIVPTVLFFLPRLYRDFLSYRHLRKQIALYDQENKRLPDLKDPATETIPWYSLLKSCDVEKCHDLLKDEELGIEGKPWKLLHCGNVCLPVFFCRKPVAASESENDPVAWLKKQHSVRMKAYCHLIEKNTGKHSSCGIIVFAGMMDAVAIKFWNNEAAQRQLDDALEIARADLEEFERSEKVGVPAEYLCHQCHLGRPKNYRLEPGVARRDGIEIRAKLHKAKVDGKKRTLHSVCGDLYQWTPPHKTAVELKLTTQHPAGVRTEK